jgi:hypothetical protein
VQPAAQNSAKLFAMMPSAAEEYREQISMGLDGKPREAQKAPHTLRKMIPENVQLVPNGKELWAEYKLDPAGLARRDRLVAGGGFVRFRMANLRAVA